LDVLKYKRKSEDSESKLKDLKQLFDASRSERNLYSKKLLEANVSHNFLLVTLDNFVNRAASSSFV